MTKEQKQEVSTALVVTVGILAFIIIVSLLTFGYAVGVKNTFVTATEDISTQFSNIKTEYQRRADLIVNMAEVAKGYANFEQDTLTEVIKARSGEFEGSIQEQMKQINGLDSAFSRLLAIWEQYPNLKAVEQYNKLTEELQRTENRVQTARTDYNNLVRS